MKLHKAMPSVMTEKCTSGQVTTRSHSTGSFDNFFFERSKIAGRDFIFFRQSTSVHIKTTTVSTYYSDAIQLMVLVIMLTDLWRRWKRWKDDSRYVVRLLQMPTLYRLRCSFKSGLASK